MFTAPEDHRCRTRGGDKEAPDHPRLTKGKSRDYYTVQLATRLVLTAGVAVAMQLVARAIGGNTD